MAKTFTPVFAQNTVLGIANFGTANTALDGTGTIADLYTAPSEGARITYIRIKATETTTAGTIHIFIKNSGGTYRYCADIAVAAATVSATVGGAEGEFSFTEPLLMKNGDVIGVATYNTDNFNAFAMGSAFN